MSFYLNNCPLCKSGQFNLYLKSKDFTVSQEDFSIVKCQQCGFTFTNPRPHSHELGKYYESENYISHTSKGNNLLNSLYKAVRVFTIREKSLLLKKWSSKGKLLDIGCGTGDFLHFNQQQSWQIDGVEVSPKARAQAENKLNKKVYPDLDKVPEEEQYTAITMWHVLEHVEDLHESCQKIVNLLSDRGTLVVAVPNHESYDAKYYREYWAGYDVPRHLYHFSKDSMKELWQKYGMKIKAVIPMQLDAYYVSLLSEKYKTGKTNYLKAGWIATKSNLKAQPYKNHSSLIFILKKLA